MNLLSHATNTDLKDSNISFYTPLHRTAEYGHLNVVDYLVNQRADINAKANGYPSGTPLDFASENGHLCVVDYLVNQNTTLMKKIKKGTLLMLLHSSRVKEDNKSREYLNTHSLQFLIMLLGSEQMRSQDERIWK